MCGIFGYVATSGKLDMDLLRYLALQTEERGRHAFGFAWLSAEGQLRCFKQKGLISENLRTLDQIGDAVAVIGHTRHFTHGSPDNNANNHPHPTGDGYLVHNGVFSAHESFTKTHKLQCLGECDSEALARYLERHRHEKPWTRIKGLYQSITGYASINLAILLPDHLILTRRGNPLHFVKRQGTGDVYFMSDDAGFKPLGLTATPLQEYEAYIRTISTGCVFKGTLPKAPEPKSYPITRATVEPSGEVSLATTSNTNSSVGKARRKDPSAHGLATTSGSSGALWTLNPDLLKSAVYIDHPDDIGKATRRLLVAVDPVLLNQLANFHALDTRCDALKDLFTAAGRNTTARREDAIQGAYDDLWDSDSDEDPLVSLDKALASVPTPLSLR